MPRTRAVPNDPELMTLADLRRALDKKERDLRQLLARRDALAADLEELGETLRAMLTGSDVAASRKTPEVAAARPTRERRAGAKERKVRASSVVREGSLQTAIRSVLERVIGPLKVSEIVDAVLTSGYATKSANLNVIVCNRLAQMRDIEKVDRGLYQLKRPAAPAPTAAPAPVASAPGASSSAGAASAATA